MARLEYRLPLLPLPNGVKPVNQDGRSRKAIVSTTEHYIRYQCGECNRTHSVLAKVRKHKDGHYTLLNSLGNVTVSLSFSENPVATRFACMKLLDALDIDYDPKTVRLVRA